MTSTSHVIFTTDDHYIPTTDDWQPPPSPLVNAGPPPGNGPRVITSFAGGFSYVMEADAILLTVAVVRRGYPTLIRPSGCVTPQEMVEIGSRYWKTASVLRTDQAPPVEDEIVFIANGQAGDFALRVNNDASVDLLDLTWPTGDAASRRTKLRTPVRNLLGTAAISGDDQNRVNARFWRGRGA